MGKILRSSPFNLKLLGLLIALALSNLASVEQEEQSSCDQECEVQTVAISFDPNPARVKEAETITVQATCGGCGEVSWRVSSPPNSGVVPEISIAQGEGESTTITLTGADVMRGRRKPFLSKELTEEFRTRAGVTATLLPTLQEITSYFDIIGLRGDFNPMLVLPPEFQGPNVTYVSFPGQAHSVQFSVTNDPPGTQWNFTASGQNGWDMWMESQPGVRRFDDKSAFVSFQATGGFQDKPVVVLRVVAKRVIDGKTVTTSLAIPLLSGF